MKILTCDFSQFVSNLTFPPLAVFPPGVMVSVRRLLHYARELYDLITQQRVANSRIWCCLRPWQLLTEVAWCGYVDGRWACAVKCWCICQHLWGPTGVRVLARRMGRLPCIPTMYPKCGGWVIVRLKGGLFGSLPNSNRSGGGHTLIGRVFAYGEGSGAGALVHPVYCQGSDMAAGWPSALGGWGRGYNENGHHHHHHPKTAITIEVG